MTRELIESDPSEAETLAAFDAFHKAFAPPTAREPFDPMKGDSVIHVPTGRTGTCTGRSYDNGLPMVLLDDTCRPQPIHPRYLTKPDRTDQR